MIFQSFYNIESNQENDVIDTVIKEREGTKYPRWGGTGKNTPFAKQVSKRCETRVTTVFLWYDFYVSTCTPIYS